MKVLDFRKVDAFASANSSGNPAAVIYLDTIDELPDNEKLELAKELKGFVSEVGFVSRGTNVDFQLRYFSSEREVDFCGHATIAILNDLIANDDEMQTKKTLSIETRNDRLMVENRYSEEKSVYISAPAPRFSQKTIDSTEIACALNCPVDDINNKRPIQIVNGGLETLVIPMVGLEEILSVSPDLQRLNEFCVRIGVDIIILYSSKVATEGCSFRTRVFAPTFGYLEDPATGSGNAALGYYLLTHDMWDGEMIKIEQNGFRDAPNFIQLFSKQEDQTGSRVWFGGGAVLKIKGQYSLRSKNIK